MLKKKERLTKGEFDRFFSSGRRFHTKALQVIYTADKQFHSAVVVGKKVYQLAVKRNKLRRQLYHLLYRSKQEDQLSGAYLVLVKPIAKNLSFAELKEQLRDIQKQIEKRPTKG